MKKVKSINIKHIFYIILICIMSLSCNRKKQCFYNGNNSDFKTYNTLKLALQQKNVKKIYEIADSSIISVIFSMTDSLDKPDQFGLIKECSKGLFFKYTSDSTFSLDVGDVDPILGFSGGSYNFIRRENKVNYVLFEIVLSE